MTVLARDCPTGGGIHTSHCCRLTHLDKPKHITKMVSSEMLRRVALVRTDVSEEISAYFIRVTRIGEPGTTLPVTMRRVLVTASVVPNSPILVTLINEALSSSLTSVLTGATRRNIPEETILHSHRRKNLKSYMESHYVYTAPRAKDTWFWRTCVSTACDDHPLCMSGLQISVSVQQQSHPCSRPLRPKRL
jgi:hypothetical protein